MANHLRASQSARQRHYSLLWYIRTNVYYSMCRAGNVQVSPRDQFKVHYCFIFMLMTYQSTTFYFVFDRSCSVPLTISVYPKFVRIGSTILFSFRQLNGVTVFS